jgi:hypothetical protein
LPALSLHGTENSIRIGFDGRSMDGLAEFNSANPLSTLRHSSCSISTPEYLHTTVSEPGTVLRALLDRNAMAYSLQKTVCTMVSGENEIGYFRTKQNG